MKTILLEPFRDIITVKKGQKMTYSYEYHPSVGKNSTFAVEEIDILEYKETEHAEGSADSNGDGETDGGDLVYKTFVFEAIDTGTSQLIIKEYFRSEVVQEHLFTITVEE